MGILRAGNGRAGGFPPGLWLGVARACITNHETAEEDVESLLRAVS